MFDRRSVSPAYILKTREYLLSKHIDLSIDFHGLAKSAFIAFIAGARFKLASSSTNGMRELSWLVSREIKPSDTGNHCVDRHFAVAAYLGASTEDKSFSLEVLPGEAANIEKILSEKGIGPGTRFAVIHPGGGWLSRRWFPERFSALIDRISGECGVQVVLAGGREGGSKEKGLNNEILGKTNAAAIDLTGMLTLGELKALQRRSE